jgi:hypothetical protein
MIALVIALTQAGSVPLCLTLPQARAAWPKQVLYAVYDRRGKRCWMNQYIDLIPEPAIKVNPPPIPENWG